jgi:hypothetical protein
MSNSVPIAQSSGLVDGATLFVAFELSKSTWLSRLHTPEFGKAVSHHAVGAATWLRPSS